MSQILYLNTDNARVYITFTDENGDTVDLSTYGSTPTYAVLYRKPGGDRGTLTAALSGVAAGGTIKSQVIDSAVLDETGVWEFQGRVTEDGGDARVVHSDMVEVYVARGADQAAQGVPPEPGAAYIEDPFDGYTAIDAVATTDLVIITDDPAGTPVAKKATVDQLADGIRSSLTDLTPSTVRVLTSATEFARTPYYLVGHAVGEGVATAGSGTPSGSLSLGTFDTEADIVYAIPSFERKGNAISKVALQRVASGGPSVCVLGLYSNASGRLYPNSKLKDFGNVNASATATDDLSSVTPAQAYTIPDDGVYWYAVTFNGATADKLSGIVNSITGLGLISMANVGSNPGLARYQVLGVRVSRTYDGTLPSTFTAGGTYVIYTTGCVLPAIYRAYSA